MIAAPVFRFDEAEHAYWLGDERIPSITQLIEKGGLLNGAQYYTEESRARGHAVHAMTAQYDLGVLEDYQSSPYAGYVAGYIDAMETIRPDWSLIEVAEVHPDYRFGGRPDRAGKIFLGFGLAEVKTAAKAKHHAIQTALQAVLLGRRWQMAPRSIPRFTIYIKPTGRWSVEEHWDGRDIDTGMDLIRRFAC